MDGFSDYIVFVDESGDHSLISIDPEFPVFALSFCILSKADYVSRVGPALQRFKFKYWGHDTVVLHEHEIRKSIGDFTLLLTDRALREAFYTDLHRVMVDAPLTIIGSVIDKTRLTKRYATPYNPYELALFFCLERLHDFLLERGQAGRRTHVVFECRGKNEDRELELTFRRIVAGGNVWGTRRERFEMHEAEPRFVPKSVNSNGLQLADLTARPIALRTLRPDQPNRAYDVIRTKLAVPIKSFP